MSTLEMEDEKEISSNEEDIRKQKKLRATAKATITKRANEIKLLMQTGKDLVKVKEKQRSYESAVEEFRKQHDLFYNMLLDVDDKEEADTYCTAVESSAKNMIKDIEDWIDSHKETHIAPNDSASHISSRSGRSKSYVSSTSSARVKASAKKAALAAKAKILAQVQCLEIEELKLKQKRDELTLQTELAMATAEERVYSSVEMQEPERIEDSQKIQSNFVPLEPDLQVLDSQPRLNPYAESWKPVTEDKHSDSNVYRTEQRVQQQLLEAIHLPKVELMTFGGDPMQYWIFMRAFENSIANSTLSDSAKLTRLMQYCTGAAGRVIQCCAVMDTSEGYSKALSLLRERFGNNHVIAETWLHKMTSGGVISQHDRQGLREFADDLQNFQETLKSMGHAAELNSQKTLASIVERLPNFIRGRWIRDVRRIRKQNHTPTMRNLVDFINDIAEELNDPVYGRLNYRGKEDNSNVSMSGTNKPTVRNKGSSFNVYAGSAHDNKFKGSGKCPKCDKSHSLFFV